MNLRLVQIRVLAFRIIVTVSFVVLSLQLWRLQIVEGEQYRLRADDNRLSSISIDAPRGIIYDRQGTILVRNRPSFTVSLIPANVPEEEVEREAMFAQLASLLNMPVTVDTDAQDVQEGQRNTVPLVFPPPPERPERGIRQTYEDGLIVPYNPVRLKSGVDPVTASLLQEWLVRLPGVELSIEPVRSYLYGPLMAHVLGYVGRIPEEQLDEYELDGYNPNDRVGLTGLELEYEQILRGKKGRKTAEVDVSGREVRILGPVEEAMPGNTLISTIDLNLQQVMESAMRKGMEEAGATSGVAIALDPRTGEVLGMVSLPSFDDNLFATGIPLEEYLRLNIDNDHPLVNHAIGGLYPPGSIFKMIPASAALEGKVIDPNDQFVCKGTMWVPNRYFPDDPEMAQPFYCWAEEGHGLVNLNASLAISCDIYYYQVSGGYGEFFDGVGLDTLSHYMTLYGLGAPTGIDLPGESVGLVPTAKWKRLTYAETWVTGDTYNMGIGQGFVLATPLQMANVTAAIANWGTLYRPQLVREIVNSDGEVIKPFQANVLRQLPISAETLSQVRQGMLSAVAWGTATNVVLPNVNVAGKTGTAEFPGPRDFKGRLPTHAWFTSFAPYEDPEIALTVFVKGGGEGSLVAAPIAREILSYFFTTPGEAPADSSTLIVPPTPRPAFITTTQQTDQQPGFEPTVGTEQQSAGQPATQGSGFFGWLVRTDNIGAPMSVLVGRVVDKTGNGIPNIQITINGGGAPVFEPTSGPNGEFRYDFLDAAASPRWNIRVLGLPGSDEIHLDVEPSKQYTVQFQQR
jgi:penicillin-binding protein 2